MAQKDLSDKVFLKKLNNILDDNYQNEEFGVKELAAKIGLSHAQLHRKIHAEFEKSTSQFIREFRLEKAIKLLKEEIISASEVSYKVGFSSPTYFNKCFNKYFGYPPGKTKYYTDKGSSTKTDINPKPLSLENDTKITSEKLSKKKLVVVLSIVLILLLIPFYFFFLKDKLKNSDNIFHETSVAVLPFKILSEEKSNQYFADGVMDDIINHLSTIKDLRVISRTTMDQYKESTKTIPQIAYELKVSYVIESTIQKYQDSVRLMIQLIEAHDDKSIWSQDFRREFKNIFSLESEIAKEVAAKLKATISPSELKRIERVPTENLDAYNLYLKGNYSFNSNNNDSLLAYKKLLYQTLELDPDFAMAYAALARIKIQRMRAKYIAATKEEIEKAKALAIKSIEIDDNARGHASLGWLYLWFEWDWEAAEKQFRSAIQINPNYAGGHVYLAEYLYNIKGDFKEARKHLDIALYLAPYSYYPRSVSASFYFNDAEFMKSIEEAEKMKGIDANNISAYLRNFLSYIFLEQENKAVKELKTGWEKGSKSSKFTKQIEGAYNKHGINGVYKWLVDHEKETLDLYSTAQYYALLEDNENVIHLLERCYEQQDSRLPYIKSDRLFKDFHSDTRFQAILDKMNLGTFTRYTN